MKKIVFLDLEDTVIDEFNKVGFASLVNILPVRNFIAAEAPDAVRLFSFALWSDHCIKQFEMFFQGRLSHGLNVQFDMTDTFTTEKLFKLCRRHGHVFEDDRECMLFHGKDYGFQRFIEMSPQFDDTEVILVDDAVETKTIQYPNRGTAIRMVNVNDLLK